MSRNTSRPPSQRQLRVGEMLRHELAQLFERGELNDPGLAGVTLTVTRVDASPDLKNATALIAPLGGGDAAPVLKALRRAEPYVRRLIAKRVDLRATPKLTFQADGAFDYAARIEALLHDPAVRRDLEPKGGD
ncbi:MAG: 30S ribosome-binding factor RbfA [Rhodospirillales bacterium]